MTERHQVFASVPSHAVSDGVLSDDEHAELLAFTLGHAADFTPSTLGRIGIDPTIRASRALPGRVFEPWRQRIEARFAELVPALSAQIGLPPFQVRRFESQLVRHNDGDFYRAHVDTRMGVHDETDRRLLSMVYYFHAEPRASTGGALRLFAPGPAVFADIAPEQNRLVAFPSWVRHEVRPVRCPTGRFEHSRFAINCWARAARTTMKPAEV